MGNLMCYDRGNYLFFQRRGLLAHKQGSLSERDEPPVLHGSCQKVWYGYQVLQMREGKYESKKTVWKKEDIRER